MIQPAAVSSVLTRASTVKTIGKGPMVRLSSRLLAVLGETGSTGCRRTGCRRALLTSKLV